MQTIKFYFTLIVLFTYSAQAQYADYSGMIRREARATQEHIDRMNAYYNKPSGSTSVFYDYKTKKDEEKERARREREQKDKEIQAFLKQQEKLEEERSEKRRKEWAIEEATFRTTAQKALAFISQNEIELGGEEREQYIKNELMNNGMMIPNYEQKITELLQINEIKNTINTAELDQLIPKIKNISLLEGIRPQRYLEYVLQLQKRFPQEEEKIDNLLLNLFVHYYKGHKNYETSLDRNPKFYELYQYLDQKYPETVLLLMKDLMKDYYNPIQHGIVTFKNNNPKASSKDWDKIHKKNDEKIKDIKFGLVGYSEKSKTLEGILELCERYNLEPMQVVLVDDFDELNTSGFLVVTDYMHSKFDKNNPRFKFLKPLAALCDKNSVRAYMRYLDLLDYKDSSKIKILDYADSMLEKGCTTAFTLYFIDHLPSFYIGAENALKAMKRFKETSSPEVFNSVINEIIKNNSFFNPSNKDLEEKANTHQKKLVEEIKKIALQ